MVSGKFIEKDEITPLQREYEIIKKEGLIGERDTPHNQKFIINDYSKIMKKRYEYALPLCDKKVVLDVGCGLGWGMEIIKDVVSKIYGIDYDHKTIKYCKEKYSNRDVYFDVMDCRNLSFKENTFDVVLLMEVIEHLTLEDGYKCISEIIRVLSPKGILLGTTYIAPTDHERNIHLKQSNNIYHLHIYTRLEMENLLSTYFKNNYIEGMTYFSASFPKSQKSME